MKSRKSATPPNVGSDTTRTGRTSDRQWGERDRQRGDHLTADGESAVAAVILAPPRAAGWAGGWASGRVAEVHLRKQMGE